MSDLKSNKIVGLITATLVLVFGFYLIIFSRIALPPIAKIIIGIAVILYFMLRMKMIFRSKQQRESEIQAARDGNKRLDI